MNFRETVHDHFISDSSVKQNQQRVVSGLRTWEQKVVNTYHTDPGCLLNIGCGGGREALALDQMSFNVVSVDIALPQLQSARKTLPSHFRLLCVDGLRLPFGSASFQHIVIWSQAFGNIPYASNRSFVLSECERVLCPNGTLSFSVHDLTICEPIAQQKGWVIESHTPEPGDFLLQGDSPSDRPCYWHYFSKEEIDDLCTKANLTIKICELDTHFGENWNNLWISVATK
jgi:ubiquinone/menaquinone biosynthesis C-methylase UbiE